jgi:hypothetical protein
LHLTNYAMRHWFPALGVALLGILGFGLIPSVSAQQLAKRLILKDGTYQLATQWEIKGDRVRYLSAERNEWEEVPESLVDWPATSKFQQDRAAGAPSPEAVEVDKEMAAELVQEEVKTPLAAPNLHLPENAAFLLLDTFQNQPQLVELQENGGEVNRNRGQNMVRAMIIPIPITSSKQTIEIEGLHATVQAHTTLPAIYINLETEQAPIQASVASQQRQQPQQPQQPEQPWDRFHIVHAKLKNGKRIVGVIKINPLGKTTQQQDLVPTTTQQLSGPWIKLTPTVALEPGEYAVVELLGRDGMNTYVWDFGVNPAAPANAGAVKPATAAASASTDKAQPN